MKPIRPPTQAEKRKRASRGSERGDVAWTASRCLRILRPLSSRVEPLRKLRYITNSDSSATYTQQGSRSAMPPKAFVSQKAQPDLAWFPDQQTKAAPAKKKYSQKSRKKTNHQEVQTFLTLLPTPFKPRRDEELSVTSGPSDTELEWAAPDDLWVHLKRKVRDPYYHFAKSVENVSLQHRQGFEKIFELHQGVIDGFQSLLDRTDAVRVRDAIDRPSYKGCRSLASMCKRQVPRYIKAETEWRAARDEDDETDVTAEVYAELESLGAASTGWPSLQEVVRAHGIFIVTELMSQKMVSKETRNDLFCQALAADHIELQNLLYTYVASMRLTPPWAVTQDLFESIPSLENLLVAPSIKSPETVRLLRALFLEEKLSWIWLGSPQFSSYIKACVRALTKSWIYYDALALFETILSLPCEAIHSSEAQRHVRKGAEGTLYYLTVVMFAILLSAPDGNGRVDAAMFAALENTLRTLAQRKAGLPENPVKKRIRSAISTGLLVLDCVRGNVSGLEYGEANPSETADTVVDIARVCGQNNTLDSLTSLRHILGALMNSGRDTSFQHETEDFTKQVAQQAASCLARLMPSLESRVFARDMEYAYEQQDDFITPRIKKTSTHIPCSSERVEDLSEWMYSRVHHNRYPGSSSPERSLHSPIPENTLFGGDLLADTDDERDDGIRRALDDSGYTSDDATLQPTPCRPCTKAINSPDILGGSLSDMGSQISVHGSMMLMRFSPVPTDNSRPLKRKSSSGTTAHARKRMATGHDEPHPGRSSAPHACESATQGHQDQVEVSPVSPVQNNDELALSCKRATSSNSSQAVATNGEGSSIPAVKRLSIPGKRKRKSVVFANNENDDGDDDELG